MQWEIKRAIPIARGNATKSASADAQNVPKTRGPTHSQNDCPLSREISSGSAAIAGKPSRRRNPDTAASIAKMKIPAPRAEPEKTRSPTRTTTFGRAGGVVAVGPPISCVIVTTFTISGGLGVGVGL